MPRNSIVATKRGKAALAGVLMMAAAGAWNALPTSQPPAVVLASDTLIKTWEGVVLEAHWDRYARIYDICYGKTTINGRPVRPGMRFTKEQCDEFLREEVYADYYRPLTQRVPKFTEFPISVQAAMLSGAYNFGVGAMVNSTAARLAALGRFREACEAQTRFNRAGGQVVEGLVRRREMGDAARIGEAELCVSGL